MSTIAHTDTLAEHESVTTISANARVDYILRFSKHVVLVIDDNPEIYTHVGNEFLGALPQDHNAAFVSISSKLNDIQIRCRIIEQLFGNTLFDPEQPLSVNVIKLAEAKNEVITIVLANAEYLSLQLSHELCQLAEIAKKLNKSINVLLLGKTQAGTTLSQNKHLFENKVSILLAENGQLISLSSSILKDKSNRNWNKILLVVFTALIIVLGLTFLFLSNYSDNKKESNETLKDTVIGQDEYQKLFIQPKDEELNKSVNIATDELKPVIATSQEVFQSLTTSLEIEPLKEIPQEVEENTNIEKRTNIQIAADEHPNEVNKTPNQSTVKETIVVSNLIEEQKEREPELAINSSDDKEIDINEHARYYQSYIEGYVIQLASFVKIEGYKSFLNTHKNNPFHAYAREVNGRVTYTVTTRIYKSAEQAKAAIQVLSPELRNRGPWVKSIQAVNNEINLYNQSR